MLDARVVLGTLAQRGLCGFGLSTLKLRALSVLRLIEHQHTGKRRGQWWR